MLRIFFILFIAISVGEDLKAQPFIQRFDGIRFNVNGTESPAPFNGGMNNARYQLVDIDADGDKDLFTFDSDTSLYFYRNTGTPQVPAFKLISNRYQALSFNNWFAFADMDGDSDFDLFTGGADQTVKYYRNSGTPANALFELIIPELRTVTDTVIYSEANCVPTLCDIDNDGDKDFFTGQSLGTITYYENIGGSSGFSFKFISDFWQNLIIISPAFDNRHGANSIEFVDIDNDLDFDLFWGDLFSKGIYFIRNDGNPAQPNVVIVDSLYPHNSPYISSGYNSTRFVDMDADGDKDLFISVLYLSQNSKNFSYYRNDGTSSSPVYTRITDNYLNNVDVGGNSNIAFANVRGGESTPDLFIGNDFARLSFFSNSGLTGAPEFSLEADSLNILSESFNYSPAFGDLDGDGDQDMILGSYIKDSLWFFRNAGTSTNFSFVLEARGHQIGLTTIGQSSTPALVDIDGDSDLDLFIGGTNGRIIYYENTGSPNSFTFTFRSNFYSNIDAGDESIPRFTDIDNDGDKDLFIGKQDGKISFYRNTGDPNSPSFALVSDTFGNINVDRNSCPDFFDYDADGDKDLFVGNSKGGIFFFRNDEVSSVSTASVSVPDNFSISQNFPNPFNPSTRIRIELKKSVLVRINIYDISGRKVAPAVQLNLNAGTYDHIFDASGLSSGIYFLEAASGTEVERINMFYVK
ncbi:MAG: T9SS type A sorting domain-containing protein [Ignavibacteria bacterium]|nr:T9SS type A sorting domain-containing protein [Ignavibacteria bacterium]